VTNAPLPQQPDTKSDSGLDGRMVPEFSEAADGLTDHFSAKKNSQEKG
jgi:hypothetical protein